MQALRQVVYGKGHPMGRPPRGVPRTLRAITVDDLAARYRQSFRPENTTLALCGRITPEQVTALTTKYFAGWKVEGAAPPAPVIPPAPAAKDRKNVYFVPRPGLSQSMIFAGRIGLPEGDPKHHMLRIVAARVPASAGAWLRQMENVTYGVHSIDEVSGRFSMYGAYLAVDARATGSATDQLLDRYDAKPAGWFDREKVFLLAREGSPFFTIQGRVRHVAHMFVRGLPVDHWSQLRQRLDDTRDTEVPTIEFEYIRSDKMQVVVVGDPDVIRQQVAPLRLGELTELPLAFE
jgi:predicted Zn-dependent peptidase